MSVFPLVLLLITANSAFAQTNEKQQEITPLQEPVKKEIKCHISGQTVDRPENETLLLAPYGTDFRVNDYVKIPVVNNKFEYELVCDDEELYELVFESDMYNGQMRPIPFISENGSVDFELYPLDSSSFKDVVIGTGKLNKESDLYKKQAEKLFRLEALYNEAEALPNNGLYPKAYELRKRKIALEKQYEGNYDNNTYRELMDVLQKELKTPLSNDSIYTDEYKKIKEQAGINYKEQRAWGAEYVRDNNSIFSLLQAYKLLLEFNSAKKHGQFTSQKDEDSLIKAFQTKFQPKYPNNPLTKKIEILIESNKIKEGNKYIDFTIPDFNGNNHTLSKEIDGKVALLDLWASWCGPCRKKSKEMIAVYNEFKEKGFVIVGVAREFEKENGEQAIIKDGYKWLNLLELKDKNEIWSRYGVGNSGGATFLIDKDGTILNIDGSVAEIRQIIEEKLK